MTTLTGRRRAKVAELQAMDRQQAKLAGLDAVSLHTLIGGRPPGGSPG